MCWHHHWSCSSGVFLSFETVDQILNRLNNQRLINIYIYNEISLILMLAADGGLWTQQDFFIYDMYPHIFYHHNNSSFVCSLHLCQTHSSSHKNNNKFFQWCVSTPDILWWVWVCPELQVAPYATSSEEEQNPEGVRRDQQRAAVCGHHINNTSCLGLVLLLPPLNLFLWTLWSLKFNLILWTLSFLHLYIYIYTAIWWWRWR